VSTLDDLAWILRKVEEDFKAPEVLRIVLHPKNYNDLLKEAAYVVGPPTASQVACRGHLWGVPIHVDPRNEQNIAYVVTRDTERSKGMRYTLDAPIEIPRRTAWDRVLEED
jgi:hypothetical protein